MRQDLLTLLAPSLVLFAFLLSLPTVAAPADDLRSDTWATTDALGRALPLSGQVRPARQGRFVGVFYFLWHGAHGTPGPYDITKILAADPARPAWGPPGAFHWWGEPAVGYFRGDDPWVHRRNLAMLQAAGVDVLLCDATNGFTYPAEVRTLCAVAEQMRREGSQTPRIAFVTHAQGAETVEKLYHEFYGPGLYKDLWFSWQGKPLILGDRDAKRADGTPLNPQVVDFFTWRYSWAWDPGHDKWQWLDKYPQRPGWHDDSHTPEELPVSVAGHPVDSLGRSYHSSEVWGQGVEPPVDSHQLTATMDRGIQFQQQWDRALAVDPEFVFVTGWNEWVAQRFVRSADGPAQMAGRPAHPGDSLFIDEYNEEFSRDLMPMKGGYGDTYYLQLVANVRRFKGVRPPEKASLPRTIRLTGPFTQWRDVAPEYRDAVGDTGPRDHAGWGTLHYVNRTGRNDITTAKVACDAKNIYFYVRTHAPLTPYTVPNWMLLLIDADQNHATGWEGYDYVVNRPVLDAHTTTLTRLSDGKSWHVPYRAAGNEMMLAVPRARLGLTDPHRTAFDFHWVDNCPVGGDITTFWYNGDSAPDGRFNYRYGAGPEPSRLHRVY